MLLRLRRERLERGLSIPTVARQAKVSKVTLQLVETGITVPYPAMRKKLAEYYGVKEHVLFRDIDAAQRYLREVAGK